MKGVHKSCLAITQWPILWCSVTVVKLITFVRIKLVRLWRGVYHMRGQVAGLWVRMLCRNFPCFAMFAMFVNNFAAFSFQFFDFVPTLLLISLPILMNTWAFWLHLQAELEYCLPPSTSCSIVHCSFLKSGWLPRISLLLLAFIKQDLIKSRSLPTSTRSLWNTKWKVCLLRFYCPPSIPHD